MNTGAVGAGMGRLRAGFSAAAAVAVCAASLALFSPAGVALAHEGHEIALPSSPVQIGANFTLSHPGTDGLLVFAPEELIVGPGARTAAVWADAYGPHTGAMYALDGRDEVAMALERPLRHGSDLIIVDGHELLIKEAGGGAVIEARGSLSDPGDELQMRLMLDVHSDAEADPLGRYDVMRGPGYEHEPLPRPAGAQPGGGGLDRQAWPAYAEYLRGIASQGKSVQAHLAALPPGDAAGFLREYPDLGDAGPRGPGPRGSDGVSWTTAWGFYKVQNDTGTYALSGVRVCAFDEGHGRGPVVAADRHGHDACVVTGENGFFMVHPSFADPDGEGNIDLRVGARLENGNGIVTTMERGRGTISHMGTDTQHDHSLPFFSAGTLVASGPFADYYETFLAVERAHGTFDEAVAGIPHVYVEERVRGVTDGTAYCYADPCGNGTEAIRNANGGDTHAVLREYGHHVQRAAHPSLYDTAPPCDGSAVGEATTHECAWVEGWSWFAAALASGTHVVSTAYDTADIEVGTATDAWGRGPDAFESDGERYAPGWVAAALWDLHDHTPEEAGDAASNMTGDVLEAFAGAPAATIGGWWAQWRAGGDPDISGVMVHNHVAPPPPPPPLPPLYNQTLFYDGFEGGLGNWTQDGDKWSTAVPAAGGQPPGAAGSNRVAMAAGCDPECAMSMDAGASVPEGGGHLRFDRLLNSTLGHGDYLRAEAGGAEVGKWRGGPYGQTGSWIRGEFPLAGGASVSATFAALLSSGGETVAVDNVEVVALAPDTEPPVIELLENPVVINATGRTTRVNVTDYVRATDALDAMPSLRLDYPDTFPLGSTNVTWTARDESGNEETAAQTFTVVDVTAPVFDGMEGIVPVEAEGPLTRVDFVPPVVTDAVDGPVNATSNVTSGLFPLGSITVLWTAVDAAGNANTTVQNVTVADMTAPNVIAPDYVEVMPGEPFPRLGEPAVWDAVDADPKVTNNAPVIFPPGNTTVTWTATDGSGNSGTATQQVAGGDATALPAWPTAVFSDDFESGLDKWSKSRIPNWRISTPQAHSAPGVPGVPGNASHNNVLSADNCYPTSCSIIMRSTVNLTGHSSATLSMRVFVDPDLGHPEGLYIWVHAQGHRTHLLDTWRPSDTEGEWQLASYDLSRYLGSPAFRLHFLSVVGGPDNAIQIDNIAISAVPPPLLPNSR